MQDNEEFFFRDIYACFLILYIKLSFCISCLQMLAFFRLVGKGRSNNETFFCIRRLISAVSKTLHF